MNESTSKLPNLNEINQRMAFNVVRVQAFVEGLSPRMDALMEATQDENWTEVGRISYLIHRCCDVYGYAELAVAAGEICEATAAREQKSSVSSKVVRLVGQFARTHSERKIGANA